MYTDTRITSDTALILERDMDETVRDERYNAHNGSHYSFAAIVAWAEPAYDIRSHGGIAVAT